MRTNPAHIFSRAEGGDLSSEHLYSHILAFFMLAPIRSHHCLHVMIDHMPLLLFLATRGISSRASVHANHFHTNSLGNHLRNNSQYLKGKSSKTFTSYFSDDTRYRMY